MDRTNHEGNNIFNKEMLMFLPECDPYMEERRDESAEDPS